MTALVLICWGPLLRQHVMVDEDYVVGPQDIGRWRELGVWRFLGFRLAGLLVAPNSWLPGTAAVFLHWITVLSVWRMSVRVATERASMMAAALFATFPIAYGCLAWGGVIQLIAGVAGFTATAGILLSLPVAIVVRHKALVFCGSALATFLVIAVQENAAFCFPALSIWCVFRGQDRFAGEGAGGEGAASGMRLRRSGWLLTGPLCGFVCYVIVYAIASHVPDNPPGLRLRSLLSTYYYQYTLYWNFLPLGAARLGQLFFFGAGQIGRVAMALGGAAIIPLVFGWRHHDRVNRRVTRFGGIRALSFCLLLLGGASVVFAVSQGFSLDMRKRYPIVAMLTIAVAALLSERRAMTWISKPWAESVFGAVVAIFIAASWLQTGIWFYQAEANDQLSTQVAAADLPLPEAVTYDIAVSELWPHSDTLFEASRFGSTGLSLAVEAKRRQMKKDAHPPAKGGSRGYKAHYSAERQWVFETSEPN